MIVLTNDDGIDAPGLEALAQAAATLGVRLVTVAPRDAMSECSHRVTTKCPIHVAPRPAGRHGLRYAVDGTPADCVRVALHHLQEALGEPVELVLSGINAGGNLGADVYISGTVAAAREAAFHAIPAAALSQYRRTKGDIDWSRNARWAARVLADLRRHPHEPGTFWNINFPEPEEPDADPPVVECPRSTRPLPVKYEAKGEERVQYVYGLYNTRTYEPGSDVDVCFGGRIAVSRIRL